MRNYTLPVLPAILTWNKGLNELRMKGGKRGKDSVTSASSPPGRLLAFKRDNYTAAARAGARASEKQGRLSRASADLYRYSLCGDTWLVYAGADYVSVCRAC